MEAYSHMVEKCEHSEVNGKNRKGFDGKKLYCVIGVSFDPRAWGGLGPVTGVQGRLKGRGLLLCTEQLKLQVL